MNLPLKGEIVLYLAVAFGFIFGVLLHRGGVANYNVIVNQFRLKDFTVLRIMLTAIIVGGVGVLVLHKLGYASYHIKAANMLGIVLGATLFGAGMVIYGYCPGTAVAAVATGSLHALVGVLGMLVGGALYAFSFPWVQKHILSVADLKKIRLPEVTGVSDWVWFAALAGIALVVFAALHHIESRRPATAQTPTA